MLREYESSPDIPIRENLSDLAAAQARLEDVKQELATEIETVKNASDVNALTIETVQIRPRKSDISITAFGLAWVPRA